MLYERWLKVARERGPEIALLEHATGKGWTFSELAAQGDASPKPTGAFVHPQGHSAGFIFTLLQAWRWGRVVCPLEPGENPPRVPLPPANCLHLKTTSATTGLPRVIAFTESQLAADASQIVASMGLRPDWPNVAAISMAHSYGFSNLVLPLLLHGIPLIIAPSPLPEIMRQTCLGLPAVTLPSVPALWRAWHEAGALSANVKLAISAGAPLPSTLEQQVFAATGIKIHNFYGSSECGGIAYDASPGPRLEDAFVGSAMLGVKLSEGGDGCLKIQSQAVGETYWPDPAPNLANGTFQTGDIAELREDKVYLRGRVSEQINVAGRKVSPGAIEKILATHPAVRECLVFGIPSGDSDRTESIASCVVLKGTADSAALKTFLLHHLPAWQIPREWRFVESLGVNQRGKISRAEWRNKFLEHRAKT